MRRSGGSCSPGPATSRTGTSCRAGFAYQWIRVDGTTEADIERATSNSYTLTSDDQGKRIRVKVSFSETAGTRETVTSLATGTVQAKTTSGCGAPSFGERRVIWNGTVLVEHHTGYGYVDAPHPETPAKFGGLTDARFSIGSVDYTIEAIRVFDGDLDFLLNRTSSLAHEAALALHVCDRDYRLALDDVVGSNVQRNKRNYEWLALDLDWSNVNTRKVYLSLPANNEATGKPAISGPGAARGDADRVDLGHRGRRRVAGQLRLPMGPGRR